MAKATKKTTRGGASQISPTEKPNAKLSLRDLMEQQGNSGTYIVNGFLEQDYNADLAGIRGLEKFDEMRRSNAQIRATMQAMELPIRSTEWQIEAGKNEEGETDELCEEIRAFVEEALFRRMEQTWDDHIREVCTMFPFGFALKEKVYTSNGEDGKVWIKNLAYRKQSTIYKWETEDGAAGVTQILPSPVMIGTERKSWVSIEAPRLLLFTNQREGDNYQGISVLRSAYRHWYMVDMLYKFDAVRHERQAVGVPYLKLPKDASPAEVDAARAIISNLRANEQLGITLPFGWEFGFADLQAGNTSDIWKSIDHHNAMIAKNILAMFMELASGDGGSRALSEDQSDFFLLALEGAAKQIDDVHTRFLIPELVDLNFDVPASSYYPKLAHRKLGSVDYSTISNILSTLITAGVLTADDALQDWARKILDLPARVVEDELEMDGEEGEIEIDPETGEPIEVEPELGEDGLPVEPELGEDGEPLPPEGEEEPADEVETDENGDPIEEPEAIAEEGEEDELDDEDNAELDSIEEELGDVEVSEEEIEAAGEEDDAEDEDEDDDGEEPEGEDDDDLDPEDGDMPEDDVELDDEELDEEVEEETGSKRKKRAFAEPQTYGELARVFRIVDAATRKKISDALKGRYRGGAAKPKVAPRYKRGQPIPEDIKRKISEGLKKALPGDMDNPKKNPVAARKAKRMRSLTQRSLKKPKSSNIGTTALRKKQTASLKKGGVIAQSRNARLKKAARAKKPKAQGPVAPKNPKATKPKRPKKAKIKSLRSALAQAKSPSARRRLKARVLALRRKKVAPKRPKAPRPKASARLSPSQKRSANRGKARLAKRAKTSVKASEEHDHQDDTQEAYNQFLGFCDWPSVIRLQNAVPRDEDDVEPRARPWAFNEIEPTAWRPLTFAEKKVNFSSLKKALAGAEGKFDGEVEEITKKQSADILSQVKRAVDNDDIKAVGEIRAKYTGELASALTKIQLDMFETGKKSVAAEIGVKVPPTAREIAGALRVQNEKIVEKYVSDLESAASTAVTQQVARRGGSVTSTATADAVAAAAEAVTKTAAQSKAAMKTLSVIGTLNLGRATVFERYPEEVYAMQYSAIIDDRTTDHCLSLDGRVVKPGSQEFYWYSPPQHYGCRSLWVEILRDEEFPPEITGIPKSIKPSKSIDAFEDLKAPIVDKDSPAIRSIRAEIEEREKKVGELEESGQFPNRLAQHQARIDSLKQAVPDADE